MATARLDIRLDEKLKSKVEKASALSSSTITDYVIKVVEEDASRVIEQHESLILANDLFDQFVDACNNAIAPNKALSNAKEFAEQQNFK